MSLCCNRLHLISRLDVLDDNVRSLVQIGDLHTVLQLLLSQCAVGDTASQGSSSRVAPDDENALLGDESQELTQFMLCRIKDRFDFWYSSRSVTVARYHE